MTPTSTIWSAQAHERGLRVLLDGVFNHVGTDFAKYHAALDGDAEAQQWFVGKPGRFRTFEGHDDLITLESPTTPRWSTTSPT